MTVDPASIPQHVVDDAYDDLYGCHPLRYSDVRRALADVLDALMDDELVTVGIVGRGGSMVRPRDVLAVVLNRQENP